MTILFVSATVYALVWVPDLVRHSPDPSEIHNLNDVVDRQYSMYEYHHNLKATHPYSSKWWEWPLDYVPVAYFYQDHRKNQSDHNGCCVYEITSMPNPVIMWFGLLCVPWVGGPGLARAQQGIRADRPHVSAAVAAVDRVAATYVRLPFLRQHSADLSLQRDRAAAFLAVGAAREDSRWLGALGGRWLRGSGGIASSSSTRFWRPIRSPGTPGTSGCGSQLDHRAGLGA